MKKKNKSIVKSTLFIIGGVTLTAVSVITLQPLIKKYGDKLYKESLKKEKIDFDNLGPEIVKTNAPETEMSKEQLGSE